MFFVAAFYFVALCKILKTLSWEQMFVLFVANFNRIAHKNNNFAMIVSVANSMKIKTQLDRSVCVFVLFTTTFRHLDLYSYF